MHPLLLRPVPVLTTVLASAALVLGFLASVPGGRADALGTSSRIDDPSGYDAQTTCTSAPQPGTRALAAYLLRAYPSTSSMGMMRACGTGATSEHKDGRAFDWGADVARSSTRTAAYTFIKKALATDAHGNRHALARRLGIMYLIYDDTIWASYRDFAPRPYLNGGCTKLATCSRTLRHLNHVHISLGFAGAAAQTSWYRERGVPSTPVLFPGTHELDPRSTAVTGFKVPATGVLTSSPFLLRAGVRYRVVATGTVRFGPGSTEVGDATCVRDGAGGYQPTSRGPLQGVLPGTVPGPGTGGSGTGSGTGGHRSGDVGSDHAESPWALPLIDTRGLLAAKALRWEGGCRSDHTYEAWYTPPTTSRLYLTYADRSPSGNSGHLTVYLARDDIELGSLAR